MVEMETRTPFSAAQHASVLRERTREAIVANGALGELMSTRAVLATLPTPVHLLASTSASQGRDVWIKRDDLTGLALGGNKVRKLELLIADAQRRGARAVVTIGGQQSNHARTVAAAAAMAGLECHLVLGGVAPEVPNGNLVVNELLGARMYFVGKMDTGLLISKAQSLVSELNGANIPAVLIPLGGSTPLGALSYAAAYLEVRAQFAALDQSVPRIVHATGSGATQAGLELGRFLAEDSTEIIGIDVARLVPNLADEVAALARDAGSLIGVSSVEVDPIVDSRYFGVGYGVATDQSTTALISLARNDGVVADPVYTAKALAALNELGGSEPVLFWHTGGTPALFAHYVPYDENKSLAERQNTLGFASEGAPEPDPK